MFCSALPKNYSPHLQRSDVMGMRAQALICAQKCILYPNLTGTGAALAMLESRPFGFWRSAIPPPDSWSFFIYIYDSHGFELFFCFAVYTEWSVTPKGPIGPSASTKFKHSAATSCCPPLTAAPHCKRCCLIKYCVAAECGRTRSQSAFPLNEDLTCCFSLLPNIKQFDSFTSKCSKPSDPMPWYDFMNIFFRIFSYPEFSGRHCQTPERASRKRCLRGTQPQILRALSG